MCVDRPFWVVGSVLYALHGCGFQSLIGVGEFFNTLFSSILYRRKSLGIARLSGAVRPDLSRIICKFIRPCLVITLWFPHENPHSPLVC